MAALMSIVALSIDTLLPAIPNIGQTINSLDPTDNQMLITMIFLGLGVGQLFFGPLSDCYGRKPVVYVGMGVFAMCGFSGCFWLLSCISVGVFVCRCVLVCVGLLKCVEVYGGRDQSQEPL